MYIKLGEDPGTQGLTLTGTLREGEAPTSTLLDPATTSGHGLHIDYTGGPKSGEMWPESGDITGTNTGTLSFNSANWNQQLKIGMRSVSSTAHDGTRVHYLHLSPQAGSGFVLAKNSYAVTIYDPRAPLLTVNSDYNCVTEDGTKVGS